MTHEPLYTPVTLQELTSSGLKSLPKSNTLTRLQLLFAGLGEGDPVRPWLEMSPGFFFRPGLVNRLVTLAPPGNKT